MNKQELRHQVALALLQNIKDWCPSFSLESLAKLLDEEPPNRDDEIEILKCSERAFAVLLDSYSQAITDQIY